ncbi:MAG: NADPH-dependent FMN reductase [Pseudomonadota bacterium]
MKLLGISGSLRKDSFNTKLVKEAAGLFGEADFEMGDLQMPLYDGDVEKDGIPAAVKTLANQIAAADAVIIASPEYNQSFSGVLKNALDWVSRVDGNPWLDKPVALIHAAAGRTGGARASFALRLAMVQFKPRLISGPEVLIAGAFNEFEGDTLSGERYLKALSEAMENLRAEVGR